MTEFRGDVDMVTGMTEEDILNKAFEDVKTFRETGFDSISGQQKLGVLQRLVTAVNKDDEYRQILLTAAFDNKQEALLASDAIAERKRLGVSIEPILDRIISQCSVKSGRVDLILQAMTHYTLNTNYQGKLPAWKRKQDSRGLQ